ncbi:MAG: Mfa1 family fimbria major subunit [Bacteroidales bacterium]|nr:Mfa1 family fimbria major subunit [Bacteroidales bacterium]
MKKYSFMMAAAALLAVVGCEKSPVENGTQEGGNVYMQFSVKMLTTKSSTDESGNSNSNANPDIEVGLDKENKISSVDIALVKDDQYFVSENVTLAEANTSTYVASFNSLNLKAGATYKAYIYANCKAPAASFNINEVSSASVASMTQDNNFWMTNAYAAKDVVLPASLAPYTTPQTPLSLGAHEVERSMARFDYKASGPFNMGAGLSLTLTDAALINQSKAHYMFRRVADNESATPVVGGVETPSNWVVDTDWASKTKDGFDAQLEDPANWKWTSLSTITAEDNYAGDYKIWCYAKENTLPNVNAQKHAVSTGVVFKAQITAGDGASDAVKKAMADGKKIYVFKNVLYGAWADVKAAADAGTDPTIQAAYNQAVVGMTGDDPVAATAGAAGFTGYSAKDGKYYVYYYYWNRHNDNLDPYTMGIMEFAVVRNNVYKLCVESIKKFGHPDPTNPTDPDPDPVKPDDPDESVNYYFTVSVKVLPWTVRINNIEF